MNTVFASVSLFADLPLWGLFFGLFDGSLQLRGQSLAKWVPIVLALMAVVAVGVLYAMEIGRLGVFRRLMLAAVRMGIVVAVAFLMLRPVYVKESVNDKRRPVVVLIDASQSMDNKDPRPAVEDQWRAAIAYGLIEPDKPIPGEPISSELKEKMPDRPKRIEVARAALLNPKLDFFNRLRAVGPL